MHGEKYTPHIPTYGNKCIGVRFSTIDMHGVPRYPTWASLETTAERGASSITMHEPVDWKKGEVIVIASTEFSDS